MARGELLGASLLFGLIVFFKMVYTKGAERKARVKYHLERETNNNNGKYHKYHANIYYCTVAQNHRLSSKSSTPKPPRVLK